MILLDECVKLLCMESMQEGVSEVKVLKGGQCGADGRSEGGNKERLWHRRRVRGRRRRRRKVKKGRGKDEMRKRKRMRRRTRSARRSQM